MLKRVCLTFGFSALLLAPAQSIAQTAPSLPASFGLAQLSSWDTHSWGVDTWIPAQTVTLSTQNDSSSATVSVAGDPYVLAKVSYPQGNDVDDPFATLTYFFEVYGPKNTAVSLNATGIIGNGLQSASPYSFSESFLEVYNPGSTKIATVAACVNVASCTGYNPKPASINQIFVPGAPRYVLNTLSDIYQATYNINFTVETNTVYEILLGAEVNISGNGDIPGSGISYIDPTLTISPNFLSSNPGYQIAFSQGISQASAVPEPSTWAMMLIGFAGIGFAGLRRAKPDATALATA